MLRECKEHSYFRGEKCQYCGEDGKFLMNQEELDILGRTMAGVLRHFPTRFRLDMDDHGWVKLYSFVEEVKAKRYEFKWLRVFHIQAIVETDEKGRYQIKSGMLRATYGHSLDVDLDLPTDDIPDKLYFPTTKQEIDILLETGLQPADRKKVHLSITKIDAETAGKFRVDDPVIIEIDAKKAIEEGIVIKKAGKTVFIVDEVPEKYLSKAP